MRKIFIGFSILFIFYSSANAGLFGDDVDLADLSQLSPDVLATLKNTEFNVFMAKVKHAGAKVMENKASEDLKTSELTLNAKKLHLKSAEADVKEAKAIADQRQIESADTALRQAKKAYKRSEMLIEWKKMEVDVQIASVKKAKIAVALAEAERDLARISVLIEQNTALTRKYNLSDFKARVAKKHKEYEKALSTEAIKIAEAKKLNAAYEKMSKQ